MESHTLYFTAPGQVAIQEETLPPPGTGQVLVQSVLSAISSGTELLVYRGQFPTGLPVDESLSVLSGAFAYPLRYGYSTVGHVIELGSGVDPAWLGQRVFAFQPHRSHFLVDVAGLMAIPPGLSFENAAFLPNMETAVNFILDGAPLVGEGVAVFGQGAVGLLTAALLARFPLAGLVTLDRYPLRRQASLEAGVTESLDPAALDVSDRLSASFPEGADLVYELSGAPAALDQAIAAARFSGRVVVGSWYGQKRAELDLGGRFHRDRLRLISSQVSTIAPELSGRWTKERRFSVAWEMLAKIDPACWVTQCFPLEQAAQAYRLLDENPGEAIQVLLTYNSSE